MTLTSQANLALMRAISKPDALLIPPVQRLATRLLGLDAYDGMVSCIEARKLFD